MRIYLYVAIAMVLSSIGLLAGTANRIYGTVVTRDGERYEGFIRWDKNEASWVDVLDGTKELRSDVDRRGSRRRGRTVLFGISFGSFDNLGYNRAMSGIRFGHIERLTVLDDDAVELKLKSGETVELDGGSTDIGDDIREILIEDRSRGDVELSWDDLDYVEFSAGPSDGRSTQGDRLYGILTTRHGEKFRGWVCWDVDELFSEDILDGREKGNRRNLRFGQIERIERHSSRGARVFLKDGEDVVLRGTNDVDRSNRGILILDFGLGQVRVPWDEFESLEFVEAEEGPRYSEFTGCGELRGTVYTDEKETLQGLVRWDADEEYGWEFLDGESDDVSFKIEFAQIASIERLSHRAALVTLHDGRSFELRGSNDVDSDNKGVVVTLDNGRSRTIDWSDLVRVEFE